MKRTINERRPSWNEIIRLSPLTLTAPFVLANGLTVANPIRRLSIILRNGKLMAINSFSGPEELETHSPPLSNGVEITGLNSMPQMTISRKLWNTMVAIAGKSPVTSILMIRFYYLRNGGVINDHASSSLRTYSFLY